MPPCPSLTPTWHNDVYSTIEYTNPSLTQAGKTIIITGAVSRMKRAEEEPIAYSENPGQWNRS